MARGVLQEGFVTTGGVVIACGVKEEGMVTAGGVPTARGVVLESIGAIGSVTAATLLHIGLLLPFKFGYLEFGHLDGG